MTAHALPYDNRRGTAVRWLREHLFASKQDGLITIVTLSVVGFGVFRALEWVLLTAKWSVIHSNFRLLLVGRFPAGEEWRIYVPVLLAVALAGLSLGILRGISKTTLVVGALITLVLGRFASAEVLPYVLGGSGLFFGGLAVGWPVARTVRLRRWVLRLVVLGWFAVMPLALALLVLFGGVPVERWGGLYLNLIVTGAGAMGALPIGIVIALGRRSQYRVIRACCSTCVEVARGLPLMVVLILSWLAIQQFLPSLWGINQVGLVPRILAAYILFTAVYVAVCVSGGLNALPKGQSEAAAALGLTGFQSTRHVLLPQAMRRALPALVGELIDLLMASTLVSVLGLTDVLAAARATTEQPAFFGRQKEVLLFVGAVFWVTAFSLSRLGRVAERALAPREAGGQVQR